MPHAIHECFTPLADETMIWRYMNFCKFQSILETESIWFSRSDKFSDKFEATPTKKNKEEEARRIIIENRHEKPWNLTDTTIIDLLPQHFGVSCWHINDSENRRMWDDYIPEKEGIAIQSTFGRLKESIVDKTPVYLGKVNYIDYNNAEIEGWNYFNYVLTKSKAEFEWESEVRGVIYREPPNKMVNDIFPRPDYTKVPFENGKAIKVDLNKMIQNIYVKTSSNLEFYASLDRCLKRSNFNNQFKIIPSKL